MRITTRIVVDMASGRVLEHRFYDHSGPVDLCKGDDVAKQQLDTQNRLQQQQLNLQMIQLNRINDAVGKYLTGGVGYGDKALSLMKTQFLNNQANQFQQAGRSVRQALNARGAGEGPVGGDYVRGLSSLMGMASDSTSQGLNQISLADEQQKLTNQFNAASVTSGNAAQLGNNVSTFGGGASNALDSYVKAANSGWMNSLMGGLGQGLGAFAGGGMASLGSSAGKKLLGTK